MSYQGHSLEARVGGLTLYREAVGVFYKSRWLGKILNENNAKLFNVYKTDILSISVLGAVRAEKGIEQNALGETQDYLNMLYTRMQMHAET